MPLIEKWKSESNVFAEAIGQSGSGKTQTMGTSCKTDLDDVEPGNLILKES